MKYLVYREGIICAIRKNRKESQNHLSLTTYDNIVINTTRIDLLYRGRVEGVLPILIL